mgnify:CR=1 FL=1
MSEKKEKTFEESVKELEKIVSELESGELDLDKSISKYSEAMKLIDCRLLDHVIISGKSYYSFCDEGLL